MDADTPEVNMPSRETAAIKWKKKKKQNPKKQSGVCTVGCACCLVHETGGSKWLANQIWSGMRRCPAGKHQICFISLMIHILHTLGECSAVFLCLAVKVLGAFTPYDHWVSCSDI